MSKDKSKSLDDRDRNNSIQNSGEAVYGLIPIAGTVFGAASVASHAAASVGGYVAIPRLIQSKAIDELILESREHSEKEIQIIGVENSELENESECSVELDEILTQLHEADSHIAETRQNTLRLGIETRSMLDGLRQQLG